MKAHGYRLFIVTIFATILALGISVYYTFSSFYKIAKADAVSIGEKAIYESSEKLNNFLLNGLDVLSVTSETVEYMLKKGRSITEIRNYLVNESDSYKYKINENFTGIYGYIDGNYVDGTDWVPPADYNPETREWFTGAWSKLGKTAVVPPYVDAQTGKIIISVTKMLYDWSVLALDIQLDELQNYTKTIEFDGYGFIIDRSGLIVAHTDESQIGRNIMNERNTSEYAKNLIRSIFVRPSQSTKSDSLVLNGEKCIVFSQQVQNDWFVVEVVSETALFSKVRSNLVRNILLSVFIFIVVGYFCFYSLRARWEANEEAARANKSENVIEGIAQLIESRDGSTGEHVKNTKKYVLKLVNALHQKGLYHGIIDDRFIETIGNAAILHDVGKIHIPDSILKKGKGLEFTNEERQEMNQHAKYGGEVIDKIFGKSSDRYFVNMTHDVVTHHHERYDGFGYPDNLKGEDIPLSARIVAIADVYDALSAQRHYKDSMPKERVIEIMKTGSGTQFDPELLKIFIELIEKETED